jgi:hypothetical protein
MKISELKKGMRLKNINIDDIELDESMSGFIGFKTSDGKCLSFIHPRIVELLSRETVQRRLDNNLGFSDITREMLV